LLPELVPQICYMDVIKACAVGCGEAEQLAGAAARLRDLPRERTRVDALGPLLLSLLLLAPALSLPSLALLLPPVLLALVALIPLLALPLPLSLPLPLPLELARPSRFWAGRRRQPLPRCARRLLRLTWLLVPLRADERVTAHKGATGGVLHVPLCGANVRCAHGPWVGDARGKNGYEDEPRSEGG